MKINININNDDITQYSSLPIYPLIVELRAASDAICEMSEKNVGNFQLFEIGLQPWVLLTRIETNKNTKVKAAIELDKLLRSDPGWIQPLKTRLSNLDIFESACNEGPGYMM